MTVPKATVHHLAPSATACRCHFGRRAKRHHDQLLQVEHDSGQLLELMELAITWHELDYSDQAIIPPNRWLEFARLHDWDDADKAARILSLATDVAMGAARADRVGGRAELVNAGR